MQAISYWIAQLLGSAAAAYLLLLIVPDTMRPAGLGTPDLALDFSRWHGMLLEAVTTFFLVFVVFATAADLKGAFGKIAGFAIGLTITMDILFAGPFTGGAMNPARAFGPALASHRLIGSNQIVYWVGPLLGGVLAGAVYDRIFLRDQPAGS